MCQSNAYLAIDSKEELIMEDVILIKPEGEKILLFSLFGEKKRINAKIKTIDLLDHKLIFESLPEDSTKV